MIFGIFIYDGVEPIDLATFGVLSMARRIEPKIEIVTIAPQAGIVQLSNGLKAVADYSIATAPVCDVVIVTGGPGWVQQAADQQTLAYLQRLPTHTMVASVCTGAMILAAAGLLSGHAVTTKREVVPPETPPIDILRTVYPDIQVAEASLVDDGKIITGGGVTLCIDTTLHIIARMLGTHVADETARIMEYSRARQANELYFPTIMQTPLTAYALLNPPAC